MIYSCGTSSLTTTSIYSNDQHGWIGWHPFNSPTIEDPTSGVPDPATFYVNANRFERALKLFREETLKLLEAFALWRRLAAVERRGVFLAQRTRCSFEHRERRPRQRACSLSTKWMANQ